LTFIRAKNNAIPLTLIESALKDFKEAFDIPVSYTVSHAPSRVLAKQQVVDESVRELKKG
jgi:hypothetical protein